MPVTCYIKRWHLLHAFVQQSVMEGLRSGNAMTLDIAGAFPGFADDHVAINVEGPLEGNERSRVGICILLRFVGISINDAQVPIQTAPL